MTPRPLPETLPEAHRRIGDLEMMVRMLAGRLRKHELAPDLVARALKLAGPGYILRGTGAGDATAEKTQTVYAYSRQEVELLLARLAGQTVRSSRTIDSHHTGCWSVEIVFDDGCVYRLEGDSGMEDDSVHIDAAAPTVEIVIGADTAPELPR